GTSYTVGGTLSGSSGSVVLNDNGGDPLTLTANGAFTFATPVPTGSSYNVTIASASAGQTCAVSNGSGTVGSGNVTSVAVTCSPGSGGSSGLQVQYQGTDANGVQTYQMTSPDNGPGSQYLRVLPPATRLPGWRTTSSTSCRWKAAWAPPSATAWIPSRRSACRTSTTSRSSSRPSASTRGTPTTRWSPPREKTPSWPMTCSPG